jgi:(R,R)-butanediol dehydrogenase/meso-butanediol dehydrogenase/diacetyl reductase
MVKASHTGFCGTDHSNIENGGLQDGTILGHETSGTVVECGRKVTQIPTGMRVIVRPSFCGVCTDCMADRPYLCRQNRRSIGIGDLPGAFAEYFVAYPDMLIPIPEGVDLKNAALAEAFAASLHAITCVKKKSGTALVLGGGPVGLALVRLLQITGFEPILLSEPMAAKRKLALEFGADNVVDPLKEDLSQVVFKTTGGYVGYETVFECSGVPSQVQVCLDVAANGGTVCVVSMMYTDVKIVPMTLNFKEVWLTGCYSNTHAENRTCLEWMRQGRLDGRPLISDLISLDQLPEVYERRIHPGKTIKVMVDMAL